MSRYSCAGHDPRYSLQVGVATTWPSLGLYGRVLDRAWRAPEQASTKHQAMGGKLPEGEPVLQVGGGDPPLLDIQEVVSALAPYGQIPLAVQMYLLEDLDALMRFPISVLGKHLAALCHQATDARLTLHPDSQEDVFLLLTEQGWQMQPWRTAVSDPHQHFARLLFPQQPAHLEPVGGYLSDRSIVCFAHEAGMSSGLPMYALWKRGVFLSGPVILACDTYGLTGRQVDVVRNEVCFVTEALRPQVTTLWYQAWRSIAVRGW